MKTTVLPIATLLLPALLLGQPRAGRDVTPDPVTMRDTLRIYYMGYAIGREHYELTSDASGHALTADFDYVDRGRRTHIAGTMRTGSDWTPERLDIARLTDTSSTPETSIEVHGRSARVTMSGRTSEVELPAVAFTISAHAPLAQHLLLLRYWMAHGRPASLAVVPGGPTNDVTIALRGRDTLQLGSRRVILDRYAVGGVAWGLEAVWLDDAGRLAGITTRAGNLMLDAVRLELEPLYPKLVASSTRDRLADLARLSGTVRPVASGTVALVGATLIDGTGAAEVADAVVVVSRGKIVYAGPRSGVVMPAGVQRVDVRGKTIAPGLWDMHTHLMQMEWSLVYLAAGVTTVRDMGNEIDFVVPLRAAVDSGRSLGPRMLLAGLVDGGGPNAFGAVNATTPAEGRAAVQRYHAFGFEQMKLYTLLKPDVVVAICQEAHRLGMTVTGHVPSALTLLGAVEAGMDHIAHLSIRGEAGSDSVTRTIAALKAHGTVMDPTASWGELGSHARDEPVANLVPGVAHLPPVLAQRINAMGTAVDTATAHGRVRRSLAVVRALFEAGVPVVAGTDNGVPGFSVAREVELYAAAGIPPMDALRAATAVPARAMRLDGQVGTLEPGKAADLIVMDANPLESIRSLGAVQMVMKGGTLYRSADIWRAVGFR